MIVSLLSGLTIGLAIVCPALAGYEYIDSSCDPGAINAAYTQAGQAVTAAINALATQNPPDRITDFLYVALGKPNPLSDLAALKTSFSGKVN